MPDMSDMQDLLRLWEDRDRESLAAEEEKEPEVLLVFRDEEETNPVPFQPVPETCRAEPVIAPVETASIYPVIHPFSRSSLFPRSS
jgi:hypothetical protein